MVIVVKSAVSFRTLCTIQEREFLRGERRWGTCLRACRGIGRFILKVVFRVLSLTKHGSHHPSLRLAFGLAVSDGKLIRRFAVTISFGVIAVVGTASLISTSVVYVSFYGAEQQFYVESVALISLDDSVQRVVALLLSDASSEGSVGLNCCRPGPSSPLLQ